MTLEAVTARLVAELRAVPGLEGLTEEPREQLNRNPMLVAYPGTGDWQLGTASGGASGRPMRWCRPLLYVEVHVVRKDLPRDFRKLLPFGDSVPAAIYAAYARDRLGGTVVLLHRVSFTFGALGWGEVETIGWRFTVEVSIEEEILL